jgi:hypothetical protein
MTLERITEMPMPTVADPIGPPVAGEDHWSVDSLDPRYEADEVVGYSRSPSDVLRLLLYGGLTLLLLAVTRWAEDAVLGLEEDVVALLSFLSPTAERILAGAATVLVVLVAVAVFVPAFLFKRYRLIGYILVANLVTGALMSVVLWWLDRGDPETVVNEIAERAGVDDNVLSPAGLAQVAASFVILAPFVPSRWRRAGVVVLVLLTLVRLVVTVHLPAEIFLSLALGALVGAGVLLAFGRPDERPTMAAVHAGLVESGLPVVALERASVDARGSTPTSPPSPTAAGCSPRRSAPRSGRPTCCSASTATSGSRTSVTSARSRRCAGRWSTRRSCRSMLVTSACAHRGSAPSPTSAATRCCSPTT